MTEITVALRALLLMLGWATSLAGVIVLGIFSGLFLPRGLGGLLSDTYGSSIWGPPLLYLAIFAISVLASLLLESPGLAFGSFFVSFGLAGAITYLVLILPGLVGVFDSGVLAEAALRFTFIAIFPFPLVAGLVGTVLGLLLAEMRG